jgi:ATP-binding cassette subfamily B protein
MKNSAIKWLYKVTGKHKISVAILLVIQAFLGISSVIFAMILKNIIDFATNQNRTGFFTYLAILIGLVAVQISLRAVVRYLEELSRSSIENNFKDRLFTNLMTKDYASVTATHSGEWLNRLTNDTVVCSNGIVEILPGIAGMIVKMVGALVMILALEPRFAYILFPGGAVLIFLTYAFRKVLKKLHKNVQEKDGKLRVFLQERLGSLMILRSFSAENQTELDAKEKMSDHKTARMQKKSFF